MGTASKKPPELSPMREYKAHFELWDEAAIDDADAPPFGNGRRVWTTPVLVDQADRRAEAAQAGGVRTSAMVCCRLLDACGACDRSGSSSFS